MYIAKEHEGETGDCYVGSEGGGGGGRRHEGYGISGYRPSVVKDSSVVGNGGVG